jgi:transcriptional regulator of acetoin/glycerol metabolism
VEAYRFRRQLYYATCAILVSIPSSYSEGVRYPSPF